MSWYPFEDGKTLGKVGPEGGVITRDEEHGSGARVTLERDGGSAPWSISCGIYGWMTHTRFLASEEEAEREFGEMKAELERLMGMIPMEGEAEMEAKGHAAVNALGDFVERFP